MMTQEKIDATLREIYSRVPKEWKNNVVEITPLTPTMAKVVGIAMQDPNFPQEKKEQLKVLQDAGYLSKQKYSENPALVKKINNFVNREIKKAVKEGRLPTKKRLAELQTEWKKKTISRS
jgi:hypothetical protein